MKNIYKILLSLLLVVGITSCAKSYDYDGVSSDSSSGDSTYLLSSNKTSSGDNDVVDNTNSDIKIIYTAEYSIYCDEDDEVEESIKAKVKEYNGGFESSSSSESYSRIVYKIPTDKLNEFLDYVDSFEKYVGSKEVYSEDITSDYNYTESRIEILEASKQQYLTLLESATTTTDIIAINKELNDINTELNSLSQTKAAYDDELSYSRVTIRFYPKEEAVKGFFETYFGNLLTVFAGIGVAILYVVPVGAVLSVIGFGVYKLIKFIKSKFKKNKTIDKKEQ